MRGRCAARLNAQLRGLTTDAYIQIEASSVTAYPRGDEPDRWRGGRAGGHHRATRSCLEGNVSVGATYGGNAKFLGLPGHPRRSNPTGYPIETLRT
ncbi:MAG: hypothetical protein RL685_5097 [Pseudomonadota bacterium]|jgi:hypothetical protein